jgi:hypothetical protein
MEDASRMPTLELILHASGLLELMLPMLEIMYQGCLRWSDFHESGFGDIAIAQSYFRLLIESTETDQYRRGWVVIGIL